MISLLMIAAFHVVSGSLPQSDTRKKKIEIINANFYNYDAKFMANATRLLGNVQLRNNNVILNCDSAYNYEDSNKVDMFGHVHIIQADTLHLYGDKMKYDGTTRIAKVIGKVKLINKSIVLTTDEMEFDMRQNIGYYNNWGKIVDTANVLVSKIGRYYSNEDLCFFKDSVKVTNKDFVLKADTLKYNTQTERVFLVGPTYIVGTTKQGTLYSERGWYDTRKNIAELYKSSKIMGKEQTLQGDTIFYSKKEGTGKARSRVILKDTTNHVAITGRTGVYNEKTKIAFVTDSAIFMQFSPKDTLFLHADTLKSIPDVSKKEIAKKVVKQDQLVAKKSDSKKSVSSKAVKSSQKISADMDSVHVTNDTNKVIDTTVIKDTAWVATTTVKTDTSRVSAITAKIAGLGNPADSITMKADTGKVKSKKLLTLSLKTTAKDTLEAASDTLHGKEKEAPKLFMAYHRVRFYKKDLQGICDSLSYIMKDSLMRLFNNPVLWSDVHQLTAEKIEYRPHKPDPSIAKLENNSFIISKEDSIKFNQISGKLMMGYIYENALRNIEVNGNAITLYYIKNKDHYSGMNKLESSKISVFLLKGKIDSISFFPKPEGKTIPLSDLTPDDITLKGFEWRESEKPKNRFDLYPIGQKRKKIAGPDKKPASKE